jgi:hypothetical protein
MGCNGIYPGGSRPTEVGNQRSSVGSRSKGEMLTGSVLSSLNRHSVGHDFSAIENTSTRTSTKASKNISKAVP